jgi:hypothetical protein
MAPLGAMPMLVGLPMLLAKVVTVFGVDGLKYLMLPLQKSAKKNWPT